MTDESAARSGHGFGDHDGVRVEKDGPVVRVTLTSPANRNAQTPATWRRLASIPELLDDSVRVVLLDAEGASFSAGLDRRMLTADGVPGEESLLTLSGYDAPRQDAFISEAQAAFTWWREVPQLTVALVRGHAIGAGFQLALACDWMLVADDALMAMRETSLGLVPDLGGTAPLVDRVGYSRALEICATGRFVGAEEAVRIGLALAQAPSDQLDAVASQLLEPVLAALAGAVFALKPLLAGAVGSAPSDQLARERSAQIGRLADLRALLAGG